ncbi:MAG: exopolysaccharide biosynthesis polyprenyl glycosylphosphotransferase [Crocinitomicaceae bacterium]
MNQVTPKYFHYFLSCLGLDCVLIISLLALFDNLNHAWPILAIWIVANLINYPRQADRRYISYYKLIFLSINQLITFFVLVGTIYLLGFFDDSCLHTKKVLSVFSILLSRIIYVSILRLYRIRGYGFNRFYMVGESTQMTRLKLFLLSNKSHGFLFEGSSKDATDLKNIENIVLSRKLNEIYCLASAVSHDNLAYLLSFSFKYGVDIHVIANEETSEYNLNNEFVFDILDNGVKTYALADKRSLIIKRTFDLFFSFFVIVFLLSWITIILGIIIKLGSKGPVLYVQPRAGRNGKYFNCLKFRSMKENSGEDQATKNDNRVTKTGKFIRKFSIDELPQFINVFLGSMSVVGPRPHIKTLNDQYDSIVNDYNQRLVVKPGITGLSQVRGQRGEIKNNKAMQHRINLDLKYIKNWTLQFDLLIIYKTIENLILNNDENAY